MQKMKLLLPAVLLLLASCATSQSAYRLSGEWNVVNLCGTNIVPAGTFWSDFQMFTFFFSDSITLAPTFDFAFLSFFVPFLSRYAHYYTRHA